MPLTFENPPPIKTGRGAGPLDEEIATELIARTGEWARVMEARTRQALANRAQRIKEGRGNCAGHTWETAVRKLGDGQHALYVRHIAPQEQ